MFLYVLTNFLTMVITLILYELNDDRRHKRLSPPEGLNIINGIVLPEPDDPRWYLFSSPLSAGTIVKLGNIEIDSAQIRFCQKDHISAMFSTNHTQYFQAILKSIQSRIAEDSIYNAKMPPKRLKSKAVKSVEAIAPKALTPVKPEGPKYELRRELGRSNSWVQKYRSIPPGITQKKF